VAVATSKDGISFNGSPKINVIVMVLVPKDQPSLYLQALSSLANICQSKSNIEQVAQLKTAEEVWKFFDRGGVILPDYVCARDVMSTKIVKLKENDTLEKAIDLFIEHHLIDVPVVDKDGDLVGVVTARELLRVCLPDYILWMDDLSPILHFEPFANVLRNEGITWLTEIMSQDYAVVPEGAPAIQVAQEMTKKNTQQAYVLHDKKLVGVVTLPQFLNKVLRD
jgi:CBS domain-containing protein